MQANTPNQMCHAHPEKSIVAIAEKVMTPEAYYTHAHDEGERLSPCDGDIASTCINCDAEPAQFMGGQAAAGIYGAKCQAAMRELWGAKSDGQDHSAFQAERVKALAAEGFNFFRGPQGGISRGSRTQKA